MQAAILNSKSETDPKLVIHLAEKLGMKAKLLSAEEIEDMGLANAMKIGRTKSYVDTQAFLRKLRR